jgi:drug/metabolite transporter (DMT)-like permease
MTILLALISVFLAALAQLLLKSGVAGATGWSAESPLTIARTLVTTPGIVGGLACFGLSVLCWLSVLARLDVSQAYPFVSLGIVLTMFGGYFFLGEPLHATRLIGAGFIVVGVMIVEVK